MPFNARIRQTSRRIQFALCPVKTETSPVTTAAIRRNMPMKPGREAGAEENDNIPSIA